MAPPPSTNAAPARMAAPTGLARRVPGLATIRRYDRAWLSGDLVAGLVLTAVLVPVGMGYAEAAGLPRHLRPLRDDGPAGRLRHLRPEPDPRPRTRLVARCAHRGDGRAARRGDPAHAVALAGGLAVVAGLISLGAGLAQRGLRHRPALEAHPLRLPERHRADGPRRPAAEAIRLLHRRRRAPGRRPWPSSQGVARRPDQPGRPGHRRRRHRHHRRLQSAGCRRSRACSRRRRRDRSSWPSLARPSDVERGHGRATAAGAARLRAAGVSRLGDIVPSRRRRGHRARLDGRHERPLAHAGRPRRATARPEPGAGRPRRGQRRDRLRAGLPDQQQRLADAGRRVRPARRRS